MNVNTLQVTETGGRDATTRHIPPNLALAVGMPSTPPPDGWHWHKLTDIARLESGHTPSRRHPEWWGGSIPWISIRDAKVNHGGRIDETEETTNELGIANSSARILPSNTVCLSRTASVGYVVVMGRPMVGSVGEVIAAYMFNLTLARGSSKAHDAIASDGRHVEVKLTQRRSAAIRHPPGHLLVLHRPKAGPVQVIYNGPGDSVWEQAGPLLDNGQRTISLRKLKALNQLVAPEARLPAKWPPPV